MIEVIKVCIIKCRIRPENYELYGEPSKHEIDCRATQFLQDGQTSVINITKHETESDIYWINDGVINCLAARKLADEGHTDWLMLNAIVTIPNIDCKTLIISLNTTRIKTKKQRCTEALYFIEKMPLSQGKEERIAPTTGEKIIGRTNTWISMMVGLPEHAIAALRSALEFKTTDSVYYESLLSCELDNWAEMSRLISNKKEQIRKRKEDLDIKPIYNPIKLPNQKTTNLNPVPAINTPTSTTPPNEKSNATIGTKENQPEVKCIQIHLPSAQPLDTRKKKILKHFKRFKFYNRDSNNLSQIASHSVQVVITSPPYWNLKDYVLNNLGNEKKKTDYINNIAAYFSDELKRVLKRRGSLFLNISDTISDGELQTIPQLLLAALIKQGWKLVGEIIWHKPKLPNNKGADGKIVRLQHNTEMIYHLVQEAIDENGKCGYDYYPFIAYSDSPSPAIVNKPQVKNKDHTKTKQGFINPPAGKKFKNRWTEEDGKKAFETFLSRCDGGNEIFGGNGGSRTKEAKKFNPDYEHVAVMSAYMPVIPILECSKIHDTILDIFAGSGTVGLCAARLDRLSIQIDIDPKNVDHGLGEYEAWHKEVYGVDPEVENEEIELYPDQESEKAA